VSGPAPPNGERCPFFFSVENLNLFPFLQFFFFAYPLKDAEFPVDGSGRSFCPTFSFFPLSQGLFHRVFSQIEFFFSYPVRPLFSPQHFRENPFFAVLPLFPGVKNPIAFPFFFTEWFLSTRATLSLHMYTLSDLTVLIPLCRVTGLSFSMPRFALDYWGTLFWSFLLPFCCSFRIC